jgi:hypothetical protein
LFGYTSGASISNLGVENVNITGSYTIGGLVGHLENTTLDNCYITGSVQGSSGYTGGLAGESNPGSIVKNCFSSGSVGSSSFTGGLLGSNSGSVSNSHSSSNVICSSSSIGGLVGTGSGPLNNCYSTGNVSGSTQVGGLIGSTSSIISNSYCTGNVSGSTSNTGGFAGKINAGSTISNSYSRGNVTRTNGSDASFGGFCGLNDNSTVLNCYSTGSVKTSAGANIDGKGFAGGFVTGATYSMTGNYYDINTSGQTTATGATGKTTDAMTFPYETGTFTGWDFTNIWAADAAYTRNNGYPFLQWQLLVVIAMPAVITSPIVNILETSATGGGNVINDGSALITARGICWSTMANPTILNHHTTDGIGNGTYSSALTGLTASFTWYVRAYATNFMGTSYGNQVVFNTSDPTSDTVNVIRSGPTAAIPLAMPVQISGVSANPSTTNLNLWTGNYQAPQAIYDQGIYVNNPDKWSNIGGNASTGTTWTNPSPGTGYGILVVDLQRVRLLENISVFQMFINGKITHIALAGHAETGNTPPLASDAGWSVFLPKSAVGAGTNNTSYVSTPGKFTVNASTRYVKIMAYNDGSLGSQSYIVLKGIKMFVAANPAQAPLDYLTIGAGTQRCFGATQTITTTDFVVKNGGSATLIAGEKVLLSGGTSVENGGYLHAWIDLAGNFCNQPKSMLVANQESSSNSIQQRSIADKTQSFKVFPNPTTGSFTIDFLKTTAETISTIEILNMMGEKLIRSEVKGNHSFRFDLGDEPSGIYIIRVLQDEKPQMQKIIKL